MNYTVEYVELKNGKKPFEEFVLSLPIHERAKVFETVNYFMELKNQNLPIKENLSKHLEHGIFSCVLYLQRELPEVFIFTRKGLKLSLHTALSKNGENTSKGD